MNINLNNIMSKKAQVFRDLLMSRPNKPLEYLFEANHEYCFGRNPLKSDPKLDPRDVRIVMETYSKREELNEEIRETKENLGKSVSRYQGVFRVDSRGLVTYTQITKRSITYIIGKNEVPKGILEFSIPELLESIKELTLEQYEIKRNERDMKFEPKQLFIGDLVLFGSGYPIIYKGNFDSESKKSETEEDNLRSESTIIGSIEFFKRKIRK